MTISAFISQKIRQSWSAYCRLASSQKPRYISDKAGCSVVLFLLSEKFLMIQMIKKLTWLACLVLPLCVAANPILDSYRAAAKQENPAFKDFSAEGGHRLYTSKPGDLMCASCHTDSPMQEGKHVKTNKVILPMAPSANPKRLTDPAKVEKWFKRNCNDVLKRDCSAQEKGNFMAYLLSK
jgi:hypothetical protein